MIFPLNNVKYSWSDLREIAVICKKSYTFFDSENNTLKFFNDIEDNANIECLNTVDKNKQTIDLDALTGDIGEFSKQVKYIKCKNTDAECFVFTYYNTLIISFVGSNTSVDWKYNFKLSKEKILLNSKFCDVHRGFYEQYQSIKNDIVTLCKGYCNNNSNPNILIIGHSLGVIGQLCGFDIKNLSNNIPIDFVSFGAPCVGDSKFVSLVDNIYDNNIRFVNNEDIIPVFLEIFGYKHSGNIIMFKNNEKIVYQTNNVWVNVKNLFFGVVNKFIPFLGTNMVIHHLMSNYIFRIDTHIKQITPP